MFVSDIRQRDEGGDDRERALLWLQDRLTWEKALDRLRRLAGVLPPVTPAATSKSAA
jgi:hypothetical protein